MENGRESSMVASKNKEIKLPEEVKLEERNMSTRNFGIET